MTKMNLTKHNQLVEDSRVALQAMRRSLIDLYNALGADPQTPQEVARTFRINRNLTWKLSRVMGAADPFASLNHLPGERSMELAMGAFSKAGAPAEAVESVREAMRTLQSVVKEHAGDREHLELTLESMGLLEREASAETSRELAFKGSSGVWGLQARTRVAVAFAAPGREADTFDYVIIAGLVGFRRLRSSVQWRLYRAQAHDDRGGRLKEGQGFEEIEPKKPGELPMLIREFCSPNMPPLITQQSADGLEICLPGGEVGNRAAFDCFFGYIYRGVPARRTEGNEHGSAAATVTLPVEQLLFDLILHKDVPMPSEPEVSLYGFPHGGPEDPSAQTERNLLPMNERLVELAGHPPAVGTPAAPRLAKLNEFIFERMGWKPTDFGGRRILLRHPPMTSRLVVRWPLV